MNLDKCVTMEQYGIKRESNIYRFALRVRVMSTYYDRNILYSINL